jgi:hypothetical protein
MIWVGQFGIAGGEALEETPWVGAFPAPSRTDEPADLYLIVEPATEGSEEFCAEMKQAIGETFHKSKLSLTGGILRALRAAHENLREWNRRSLKDHRIAAGVSCIAVRGPQAYLAQVAPAAAAFYRRGAVQQLRPALPPSAEPLGLHEEFWPDFSQFELQDGDRLLIMSPALADNLAAAELAAALALPGEDALPEIYRRARSLANCGALLLAQDSG